MADNVTPLATGPVEIHSISFGIRFGPIYKVSDNLGAICDEVLSSPQFGSDVFPKRIDDGVITMLINEESRARLALSERDCVLSMPINSKDFGRIRTLAENFDKHIVTKLIDKGMAKVGRYGFLAQTSDCSAALNSLPTEHYLPGHTSPTNLDLRFTRKLPSEEAKVHKRVDDYRQVIHRVQQSEEGEVKLALDYQEIFEPRLDRNELKDHSFVKFVDRGLAFQKAAFPQWIDEMSVGQVA